jgi:hypothetical protein
MASRMKWRRAPPSQVQQQFDRQRRKECLTPCHHGDAIPFQSDQQQPVIVHHLQLDPLLSVLDDAPRHSYCG